ncbi:hypothetical protein V500_07182, partial [Pseudogymnoascus sp. VKM F-4518 (FW-2643)]
LAEPDARGGALADGAREGRCGSGCEGCGSSRGHRKGRRDEAGEREREAGAAEASVAVVEEDRGWGFNRAILPTFFEEIPVRRPRPVAQCMFLRQLHGVVGAAQRAADELGAEGEEVGADLAAG